MGVRGLDREQMHLEYSAVQADNRRATTDWLAERGLVKECSLSALSGTRIGIDANHYLRRLLAPRDSADSDSFTAATGGTPLGLTAQIEKDLKTLEKANVKPVFVFPGISPIEKDRSTLIDDPKTWRRTQAWEHYEQGRVPQAQAEFAASNSIVPADVIRLVHRMFKPRSVEFVVAPYLSWAQLVYLERHERAYVHSIYGPSEILMFDGIDRVILDVDFHKSTISFVSKSAVIHELGLTHDQFLDSCILAGFEGSVTFPGLDLRDFNFRGVSDLVKSRGSAVIAINAMKDFPAVFGFLDIFSRARCLVKFSLVLVAQEGRVLPLPLVLQPPSNTPNLVVTAADIPNDLHEIFTPHLPDEVYYQLFRGLVSPQVLVPIATGQVLEAAPLCGGTPEYDRYIKALTETPQSPRCIATALVSSVLHPMWSKRAVAAVYYFDPMREYLVPHSHPSTNAFIESVSRWNVDHRHVHDELRRQLSSTIDLSLCLGATSTQSLAQRTIVPKQKDRMLEKKDEIVANTIWRFLELRGFLNQAHQHTPHAQALYIAMRASKVNDKFQESLYLAMELLRAGMLHNQRIGSRAYSGGPNFQGSDADKRSMLLVMRVLSIVPLAFKPGPWTGPLSRELLVFNSFLHATTRSMRTLLEATALNLLLRSDARRSREDYVDVALSLPFCQEANTGMGILFKAYGDAVCHVAGGVDVVVRSGAGTHVERGANADEQRSVRDAKEATLGMLEDAFPNVKNVRGELERGFRFWQTIMLAVRSLRSYPNSAIPPELANQFEAADAWLKPFALQ